MLDFDRDLPTTAADVEALRKARVASRHVEDYLAFLATFREPTLEELRARPITRGEPFTLPK